MSLFSNEFLGFALNFNAVIDRCSVMRKNAQTPVAKQKIDGMAVKATLLAIVAGIITTHVFGLALGLVVIPVVAYLTIAHEAYNYGIPARIEDGARNVLSSFVNNQ